MLCLALAFAIAQVPNGAYSSTELCRVLTEASAAPHSVVPSLRDYPVFVASKSGDPETVRKLVASAMRAEWKKEGNGFRLMPVKVDPLADLAYFEAALKKTAAFDQDLAKLPVKDLYQMAPGQIVRFTGTPGPFRKAVPALGPSNGSGFYVRRFAAGQFELGNMQELTFTEIPEEVQKALGPALEKQAMSSEDRETLQKLMADPMAIKIDWTKIEKNDPIALLCGPTLLSMSKQVGMDMAVVLTDFAFFPLSKIARSDGTVKSLLSEYCPIVTWRVDEGALIGTMPMSERSTPSQSDRQVLQKFVNATAKSGVVTPDALSGYVAGQRKYASDSWCDAMMLVMANRVLDQEFIGDYPFNNRLYTKLSRSDWQLIRTGEPFQASRMSTPVQQALRELLLQSRNRIGGRSPDPAFWPSLNSSDLVLSAELVEEPVLIAYTGHGPDVGTVEHAAMNYELRRKEAKREILYQPGQRRKLKLKISSAQAQQSVDTGFSEVELDTQLKPVAWPQLPAAEAKKFRETLAEAARMREIQGTPPPR